MGRLIFDLDQTIINSIIAENFRKNRSWNEVYKLIPSFELYDNILDVMKRCKSSNYEIAIVTSSPSTYCNMVLNHWKIPHDFTVCYHDTNFKKPHPEPILKAIGKFQNPKHTAIISFGDRDIDIIASKNANVVSVGCLWGALDSKSLQDSKPDHIIKTPSDILTVLGI